VYPKVKKERQKGDLHVWNTQPISWLITITHMFKHCGHNNNLQYHNHHFGQKIMTITKTHVNNNNDNIKPIAIATIIGRTWSSVWLLMFGIKVHSTFLSLLCTQH
jgi:hypothetical protein